MSYNTLPDVTVSAIFGTVKKIVWFEVEYNSGNFGTFNVNLFITSDRTRDVKVTIFNNGSNQNVYEKNFLKTSKLFFIICIIFPRSSLICFNSVIFTPSIIKL